MVPLQKSIVSYSIMIRSLDRHCVFSEFLARVGAIRMLRPRDGIPQQSPPLSSASVTTVPLQLIELPRTPLSLMSEVSLSIEPVHPSRNLGPAENGAGPKRLGKSSPMSG